MECWPSPGHKHKVNQNVSNASKWSLKFQWKEILEASAQGLFAHAKWGTSRKLGSVHCIGYIGIVMDKYLMSRTKPGHATLQSNAINKKHVFQRTVIMESLPAMPSRTSSKDSDYSVFVSACLPSGVPNLDSGLHWTFFLDAESDIFTASQFSSLAVQNGPIISDGGGVSDGFCQSSQLGHIWLCMSSYLVLRYQKNGPGKPLSREFQNSHVLVICWSCALVFTVFSFLKSGHFCQGVRLQIGFRERHHKNLRRQTILVYVFFSWRLSS